MVNWKDGVKVSDAHVNEDGTITEAEYEGDTPLSAHNLNLMQQIDIASIALPKRHGNNKQLRSNTSATLSSTAITHSSST